MPAGGHFLPKPSDCDQLTALIRVASSKPPDQLGVLLLDHDDRLQSLLPRSCDSPSLRRWLIRMNA
jgi:hypothetical protein